MSGIAGIIRFDGAPVEPGLVEKMTSAMAHRGPDGIRHWVRGSVALGQCMLRTTPESLEEEQPLANEDESLVLVMDGRVDNWEELRKELLGRGAHLRTRADAELVLRAYETWGKDCLLHIDGDFALVIWDERRRAAFCARDRMGNKPFNYHWDGKALTFSSEVHAILRLPSVREEPNNGTLAEYLANEWHSREETFWKGVRRLVAAHRMEVGLTGPRPLSYWSPDLSLTLPYKSDEEYVEHYRDVISDVVRRLSRSHRPVACDVSGGLDSSAIFATAEKLRREAKLPVHEIAGYTLDFDGVPDADELMYVRAVGEHLGINVSAIAPAQKPLSWYREWAELYREFPGYPNGSMSMVLRKTAQERGARALLAGIGGDQWLGDELPGNYYAEELLSRDFRQAWLCLRSDIQSLGLTQASRWLIRSTLVPLLPTALKRAIHRVRGDLNTVPSWLSPTLRAELENRRAACQPLPASGLRRRSQKAQLAILRDAYTAAAVEHEERLCSSLHLELRMPYQGASVVQLAFSTPERLRSLGRTTKYSHRRAMTGVLPAVVVDRTSKADFMVVFRRILDNTDAELRGSIGPRRTEWIQPGGLADLWACRRNAAVAGRSEWRLWTLVGCDSLL